MRATFVSIVMAIAIAIGVQAWAQQTVALPNVATSVGVRPVAAVVVRPDRWRYSWYGNRWWYYTPENRWMWYGDAGWTPYVAPAPITVYSPAYPAYSYPYYSYYPYGYYGYYGPRVAVGVGPRGFVRAGRVGVWW